MHQWKISKYFHNSQGSSSTGGCISVLTGIGYFRINTVYSTLSLEDALSHCQIKHGTLCISHSLSILTLLS